MKRISDKIEQLLNLQIQKELTNSLLYQAMSNWLNFEGFTGAAKLYAKHAVEEMGHRDKFIKYMLESDAMPIIPSKTFDEIPNSFTGIDDIINSTLKREIETTESIKKINYQAMEDRDCITKTFLIDLLAEQIEEMDTAQGWVDRLELYKSTNSPIIMLDQEMGKD